MKEHLQHKTSSNFFETEGGKSKSNAIEIPLPVTPGRHGFSPALSLGYNSRTKNVLHRCRITIIQINKDN